MATNTRKLYYPNPVPNSFYSGNSIPENYVGIRENAIRRTLQSPGGRRVETRIGGESSRLEVGEKRLSHGLPTGPTRKSKGDAFTLSEEICVNEHEHSE
jgi:hypothetical protein